MPKRKPAIGRIDDKTNLERLRQLPEYFELNVNIKGASDEVGGSIIVYNLIYKEFKKDKIGMSQYGFVTLEEARQCKRAIEDIARSKGFEAIVTIKRVTEVE